MPSSTTERRPRLITIVAATLVAAVLGGGIASAGLATFNDVPPEHPFFDEIEAIAEAGITTGFNDGSYRPSEPVSRGAMAAFMGRGFGRTASATDTDNNPADNTNTTGASVNVQAGATGAGTGGYVVVSGTVQMSTPVSDCQCTLAAEVRDATDNVSGSTRTSMSNTVNVLTINTHAVAVQGVFPIDGDEGHTFQVRFRATTAGANTGITVSSDVIATYVPFDGSGNSPS